MAGRTAKQLLRKNIKKVINALSDNEKMSQSWIVAQKLFLSDEWQKSQRISVFLSMSDEIQTETILKQAFALNKDLFIPKYIGPNMDMVRLESMDDLNELPITSWNIRQPADTDLRENALDTGGLDLILVPGLAFTKDGKRLGRGKGYYDTYLARCASVTGKEPCTVALAFREQICDSVPTDPHDFKIDSVVYDDQKSDEP